MRGGHAHPRVAEKPHGKKSLVAGVVCVGRSSPESGSALAMLLAGAFIMHLEFPSSWHSNDPGRQTLVIWTEQNCRGGMWVIVSYDAQCVSVCVCVSVCAHDLLYIWRCACVDMCSYSVQ